VKMAIRTDNIITLVNMSSAISNAGANEYIVVFSGMLVLLPLMM